MAQCNNSSSGFWKAVRTNMRRQRHSLSVQPVSRSGNLPLSFAQERLWQIDQAFPGNVAHNLRAVYRLKGQLDVPVLERSLREIIRRHEILRTTFPAIDGQPVQQIAPDVSVTLPVFSLAELTPEQQEAEIRRLATAEAQQPFELTCGPLLRIRLLRLAEDEHVLLRMIHHIVYDRWSDSIFMRELATIYKAFANGLPSPLPDLAVQYADFAACQRTWLQGEILNAQLEYWKTQLAGSEPLGLPFDYAAPAVATYRGGVRYLLLPKSLADALKALARKEEVSFFVILLTAFQTLLYQYTGQEDMLICSPVAGRQSIETKNLIGYFSNIVLIRSSLRENPSLRELFKRVSASSLQAHGQQDVPLQHLAEALHLPGALLSRAMFALQNVPNRPAAMNGVSVIPQDIEEGIANFDLSLSMKEEGAELIGVWRYKTDLFQETTIAQMTEHFQSMLETLLKHPEQRLADLPRYTKAVSAQAAAAPQAFAYVAPQNELEQTIATAWQAVLHTEQIGIYTNFFDIGGRSLAMLRICTHLQTALKRDIAVGDLFKHPTIHGMTQYLSQQAEAAPTARLTAQNRVNQQKAALRRQQDMMKLRRQREHN